MLISHPAEILWILTKERNTVAAATAKDTAVKLLKGLKGFTVYESYLTDVNQSGCTAEEEGIRIFNETSTV